ncbi:MAG TPA: hypothetical protein O0X39_08015 [Methanocorpusculum sp.]|nr:hypothetical protein [Methanocorpusculum sp.]
MKKINPKTLVILILILLTCATIGGTLIILKNPWGVLDTYPEIVLPITDCGTQNVAIEFPFQSDVVKGSVDLKLAPYIGAQKAEKEARLYGDSVKNSDWMKNYYLAVTNDPALEDVYSKLTAFFKDYAASHNLTDDEYVELVTLYVQNIPYKTTDINTKFPVETVIDNWGDCDDKSVLLAGLLSYAGFDTALASFQDHMTGAIMMKNGNYVLIETTSVMYIGDTPDPEKNGGIDLSTPLGMYKIGNGTKVYHSNDEVNTILSARDTLTAERKDLEEKMRELEVRMAEQKRLIDEKDDEILIPFYNYNVDKYNEYAARYNDVGKALARIYDEPYNRKGVYEAVKNIQGASDSAE